MKKVLKKIFLILLALLIAIVVLNFNLVIYGLEQASGQLKIIYKARPIAEVLKDIDVPDTIKYKLKLVWEIKKFAEDSLAINSSDNYETYYDQKGSPAIWVITGCEPFALKAYEWKFPFLGTVSYKGFFNKSRAIREEKELKEMGYDSDLGTASGWSTLGWFKDPVLSGMLKRKEGSLANLIIHELTHGTLFIKDSVAYNENLANFIGDKGAILFLKNKYGNNSEKLAEYLENKVDKEKYISHILRGAGALDDLYKRLNRNDDTKIKNRKKSAMIRNIILSIDTINFYNKSYYSSRSFNLDSINNTFFIDYMRYNSKQGNFEEEYQKQFNGDLRTFLKYLKNKYPSL